MKIGIDVSVLQTPHRMRGIGAVLLNFINNLPADAKKEHSFVFYIYSTDNHNDPLELLDLKDVQYEVRIIKPVKKSSLSFPGKLRILNSALNHLYIRRDVKRGDSRIKDLKGIDHFMQFDQNLPLPPKRKIATTLIIYDLIPYIMESDYLWSYKTARAHKHSRKGALRLALRRRSYIKKIKDITSRATNLIAISQHTKDDFVKYLNIDRSKITVCHLGVTDISIKKPKKSLTFTKQVLTSWGYLPAPADLHNKKFLLFVGGADPRRKLHEAVAAFNNLRARGEDIYLVFAGDTMQGPTSVPNVELQSYFKHTSYTEYVYFLGFVDDNQREWLYQNALAFVYPSVYEGFGLPVLEAMRYGTPVITYKNSSITEIAGEAALYAEDYRGILSATQTLLEKPTLYKEKGAQGKAQAAKYSWGSTVQNILQSL